VRTLAPRTCQRKPRTRQPTTRRTFAGYSVATAWQTAILQSGSILNTPQLTMLPGGHVGIAFQGIPGRQYQIQRSTNLSTWTTIATVTAASNGAVEFTDEDPPDPSGFYRLRK